MPSRPQFLVGGTPSSTSGSITTPASFKPISPARLSPAQLDTSAAPLVEISQSCEPGAVVQLIQQPDFGRVQARKDATHATCFVVSAELDQEEESAVSETEETPKEVVLPYHARRNRTIQPIQRQEQPTMPVPTPDARVIPGRIKIDGEIGAHVPMAEWDGNIHCHIRRYGRCMMRQVNYSTFCSVHSCQAVLEDGLKCGNLVVNPQRSRFCKKGYHKETSTFEHMEELKAKRLRQNVIDREEHLSALQEGRDWVIANHPDLIEVPPVVIYHPTSQPLACPSTRSDRSSGSSNSSRGVFDCYSPEDWIGGMWYAKGNQAVHRPAQARTETTTRWPIC